MIATLLPLTALAIWAIIATIDVVQRDGYGRMPDARPVYYPLP